MPKAASFPHRNTALVGVFCHGSCKCFCAKSSLEDPLESFLKCFLLLFVCLFAFDWNYSWILHIALRRMKRNSLLSVFRRNPLSAMLRCGLPGAWPLSGTWDSLWRQDPKCWVVFRKVFQDCSFLGRGWYGIAGFHEFFLLFWTNWLWQRAARRGRAGVAACFQGVYSTMQGDISLLFVTALSLATALSFSKMWLKQQLALVGVKCCVAGGAGCDLLCPDVSGVIYSL